MVDSGDLRTALVRLRMADRPGALAAVAGRIGAVRGDLVFIEILERGDGWVIDEVFVELPGADLMDLMVREIEQVEDLEVLEVVMLDDPTFDPQLAAFEVADILIGANTVDELFESLCVHTRRAIRSDWVCVVSADGEILAATGNAPDEARLASFVRTPAGSGDAPTPDDQRSDPSSEDAFWVPLPSASAGLVLGRGGSPLRARERHRAAALARIADSWLSRLRDLRRLSSMMEHPSLGTAESPSGLGRGSAPERVESTETGPQTIWSLAGHPWPAL